jgi:hypothetical protein
MLTSKNEHRVVIGLLQMPLSVFAAFFGMPREQWNWLENAGTVSALAQKNAAVAPSEGRSF